MYCFGEKATQVDFCVSRHSSPFAVPIGYVLGFCGYHYSASIIQRSHCVLTLDKQHDILKKMNVALTFIYCCEHYDL